MSQLIDWVDFENLKILLVVQSTQKKLMKVNLWVFRLVWTTWIIWTSRKYFLINDHVLITCQLQHGFAQFLNSTSKWYLIRDFSDPLEQLRLVHKSNCYESIALSLQKVSNFSSKSFSNWIKKTNKLQRLGSLLVGLVWHLECFATPFVLSQTVFC